MREVWAGPVPHALTRRGRRTVPGIQTLHRVLAAAFAAACGALAVWYFAAHGWLYYFGDAEAHLNIARRIVDTSAPGWEQLGDPWLPVPHLLIAPFAASMALWRSGLAGSVPACACFVLAAFFLFQAALEQFESSWAAWTALAVFVLNPNALYLQSTAMTEPFFAAEICGLLWLTIRFRRTQRVGEIAIAGGVAALGALTRYEGWFLLPFAAVYFFGTARRRWLAGALFSGIAAAGPALWLFYNWWLTGNALDFYNGPNSALAIQGPHWYPGLHSWTTAWLYFRTCVRLVLGNGLYWLLAIGLIVALFRGAWWPVLLLLLPPVFYIWSMHGSGSPIYMPQLWPHSWYNTRYGLAALPLAAFCAGALARKRWSVIVITVAILPWLLQPGPENWITWKESERNSISRRAWTGSTAKYLLEHTSRGDQIAAGFNDTIGAFRWAGIPLRDVFHPGDGLQWQAAVQRPDLLLNTSWIVCIEFPHDPLCAAAARTPHYILAKRIIVSGAEPVAIYRNVDTFFQGAWRP